VQHRQLNRQLRQTRDRNLFNSGRDLALGDGDHAHGIEAGEGYFLHRLVDPDNLDIPAAYRAGVYFPATVAFRRLSVIRLTGRQAHHFAQAHKAKDQRAPSLAPPPGS
jgi:hypothetical protein